ncbi:ras-related protein Rab-32 isoform X1 [Anthonomus grandis grandis]|uniref:ras-related protein Rab-32 isoform X1 n=1 Tax=Anthonomus grandis grandis TaxID=2921223 RepID=UPI0021665F3F|nr:ras-related protein Rab-32 isoform X1 [Anthonomus grandis grandis]
MKNESEPTEKKQEEAVSLTKRAKKILIPPKSPKSAKLKRANFLIRKLKLKSKSAPTRSESADISKLPSQGASSQSTPVERQTPEGDDNFVLTKSASETNLQESWKSSENIDKDTESASASKSEVSFDNPEFYISSEPRKSIPERTKSLENLRKMPAYGELILDSATLGSNASTSKPKDHLYKILVIGDLGTGKTSIIKRYVHRFFTQHYRATIGVDFALKVLNWDENTLIRLQLWDIAGQERYGNMTRVYYKEAVGAFIVFDVTRRNTFESVANWKQDLDSKVQLPDGSHIPCVLLANKCDQQKEGLVTNPAKMDEYCRDNGFSAWFETSAKDNINIDEAARALVEKILEKDSVINNDKRGDQFSITRDSNPEPSGNKCSC